MGVPVPWPLPTAPDGWLKYNGAAFDKAKYPKLAALYPAGVLPDLRGEFIRGWDDGRGADNGRTILTSQGDAIRNITGGDIRVFRTGANNSNPSGAFIGSSDNLGSVGASGGVTLYTISFDASRVVPTSTENRPRNIAFNYIVRAA